MNLVLLSPVLPLVNLSTIRKYVEFDVQQSSAPVFPCKEPNIS